jgi:6-phosphogluconolactonase (cycloisomerase 2 family)
VFAVKEDGTIEKKGYVPTKEHPRNFLITPCGKYLIVASKNTCTLQLFKIGADGIPVATDSILELTPNAPTCVVLR